MDIKKIGDISGISLAATAPVDDLMKSIELASSVAARTSVTTSKVDRLVALSAIQTVNTLLAASSSQCTLAAPPAEIDMVQDSTGSLIYRCQHPAPHRWNLAGQKI